MLLFYTHGLADYNPPAIGETNHAAVVNVATKDKTIMGDKSPKSNQKKNSQKQAANASAQQKKHQATASSAKPKK